MCRRECECELVSQVRNLFKFEQELFESPGKHLIDRPFGLAFAVFLLGAGLSQALGENGLQINMTRNHFFCFFSFSVFCVFCSVFWLFAVRSHFCGALLFFSIAQKSHANQYDSQSLFIEMRCVRTETSTVHKKRCGSNDVGQRSALRALVRPFCPYKGYKALL